MSITQRGNPGYFGLESDGFSTTDVRKDNISEILTHVAFSLVC